MTRTYHRTADGQQVDESDAFDERGQLRDGHTMRTKLTLMDGVPVHPLTDDWRSENIARYNARIGDAWRNPPPVDLAVDEALLATVRDCYERYDRRLRDAWRS